MFGDGFLVFTAIAIVGLLVVAFIAARGRSNRRSRQNLALGYERRFGVIRKAKHNLTDFDKFVLGITPPSIRLSVANRLRFVGKQGDVFVVAVLKNKYTLLILGLAGALAWLGFEPSNGVLAFIVAFGLFFIPDLRLSDAAKARKLQIGNLLPDSLDQLTLLVDSGLDFQTAFVRVCGNSTGFLNDEFKRTLADLQLGITRKEAFENLGERTGSPVLKNFARSMVLADLFGVPISNVLRSQAQDLRNARRAKAEEEAQKIPTKITFPLIVCLLPVILILLLGPSIINAIEMFKV